MESHAMVIRYARDLLVLSTELELLAKHIM